MWEVKERSEKEEKALWERAKLRNSKNGSVAIVNWPISQNSGREGLTAHCPTRASGTATVWIGKWLKTQLRRLRYKSGIICQG